MGPLNEMVGTLDGTSMVIMDQIVFKQGLIQLEKTIWSKGRMTSSSQVATGFHSNQNTNQ